MLQRIRELVDLCKTIDGENWLLDVQCQEHDDLVSKWRAAYQYFTTGENEKCGKCGGLRNVCHCCVGVSFVPNDPSHRIPAQ